MTICDKKKCDKKKIREWRSLFSPLHAHVHCDPQNCHLHISAFIYKIYYLGCGWLCMSLPDASREPRLSPEATLTYSSRGNRAERSGDGKVKKTTSMDHDRARYINAFTTSSPFVSVSLYPRFFRALSLFLSLSFCFSSHMFSLFSSPFSF